MARIVDTQEIKALHQKGHSYTELSKIYGKSDCTIKDLLKSRERYVDLDMRLEMRPYEPEEIIAFIKSVKIGDTYRLIERDAWETGKRVYARYRVIGKYPYFCKLQNGNKLQTRQYIELMMGED